MKREESGKVTIAEIAHRAGVSSATVSYVLSGRQDVKISDATRERILALCSQLGYEKGAARKLPGKVTIDDIAREAGVSTATVSYIINDRKDVKISEETRRKVLQICNLRQYTPSSVARLLAGKKANLIGICMPTGTFPLANAARHTLLAALCDELQRHDYDVVLFAPADAGNIRIPQNLEGILCVDLTTEEFYVLKEHAFVPIVAVDMIVDDPLFFKLYLDYAAIVRAAKQKLHAERLTYVTYPPRNRPCLDALAAATQAGTLLPVTSLASLIDYVRAHPQEAYLFADEQLYQLCAAALAPANATYLAQGETDDRAAIALPLAQTASCAVLLLQSAIRREDKPHTCKLAPLAP